MHRWWQHSNEHHAKPDFWLLLLQKLTSLQISHIRTSSSSSQVEAECNDAICMWQPRRGTGSFNWIEVEWPWPVKSAPLASCRPGLVNQDGCDNHDRNKTLTKCVFVIDTYFPLLASLAWPIFFPELAVFWHKFHRRSFSVSRAVLLQPSDCKDGKLLWRATDALHLLGLT